MNTHELIIILMAFPLGIFIHIIKKIICQEWVIYKENIPHLVNEILENKNIQKYTYSPVYYGGDVWIEGEVTICAYSDEEAAKNIYAITKKMFENDLIYSMKFIYGTKNVELSNMVEEPSYESISEQLQQ